MEGAATVTIATLLLYCRVIFSSAIGWAGTVGSTIVSTPILLLFCAIPLVGLGVGLFKRLLNV